MPRYTIHATLNVPAWTDLDADSEAQAETYAEALSAEDFEHDMSAAVVSFNVIPAIEPA